MKKVLVWILYFAVRATAATGSLEPESGDFTIRGFRFESGETLEELKIH